MAPAGHNDFSRPAPRRGEDALMVPGETGRDTSRTRRIGEKHLSCRKIPCCLGLAMLPCTPPVYPRTLHVRCGFWSVLWCTVTTDSWHTHTRIEQVKRFGLIA